MNSRYSRLTAKQAALEGDLANLDASQFAQPSTPEYDRALDGLIPLFREQGLIADDKPTT